MATEIKVPSAGESVTEGILARWLKKEGERVKQGEPVLELETDKATMEVPAPADGVLKILVQEGQTVQVGTAVGSLDDRGAGGSPAKEPPPARQSARAPAGPPAKEPPAEEHRPLGGDKKGKLEKEEIVNRLEHDAAEQQRQDKQPAAAVAEPAAPKPAERPPIPRDGRETRQPMSAIRQRIAERLVASQKTTASLTTFNEADLSAVMELRSRYKERFRDMHGANLGFMSFFVKACVEALKAFPLVNARIDGSDIVYQNFYDIGVAVSTERGLMVPVIRDADRKSFADIEQTIEELARKAREGKITLTDLQGGSFTITNGGVFGSLLSTPILNPPQSAILGMHTIQKRPVAVDDQIVIRPMMYLALSYDHRLIDGREAVQFLVRVKECVERPERMLLKI